MPVNTAHNNKKGLGGGRHPSNAGNPPAAAAAAAAVFVASKHAVQRCSVLDADGSNNKASEPLAATAPKLGVVQKRVKQMMKGKPLNCQQCFVHGAGIKEP